MKYRISIGIKMIKTLVITFSLVCIPFAQEFMTAEDAIRIGFKNNFDIQIARNDAKIANNNQGKGTAGFLPTLDLLGNYQKSKVDQSTNSPFSFGSTTSDNLGGRISLNWTLFDGFGMFVNNDQYDQLATLGEYQSRNIIETTVVAILSAYYNLVQQEQLLDVALNAKEISKTRLDKEKLKQDLGSASSTDYWNAQVSYNNDAATLINQELRRLIAQNELNVLLGRDVDTPVEVTKQIIIPDLTFEYDEILELAREQNSRLIVARQAKKVADNNVSLSSVYFYPRLSFIANYGYDERKVISDRPGFEDPVETVSRDGLLGLNLTFNIFNGMRDKIDRQNARLEAQNQEYFLQDQENRIGAAVRETLETFYKRMELIDLEEQNVVAAEKNLQLNQDRYSIGAASSLEFRDAQVNLIRSQSTLIVARFQARITRLELEQLMGNWEIPE
jgi:outer membrane protein TolC